MNFLQFSKFELNIIFSKKFIIFGNSCFYPKTGVYKLLTQKQGFLLKNRKLFLNFFQTFFAKFLRVQKKSVISKKFLNFKKQTFPKLAKTKSSENSVFRRALVHTNWSFHGFEWESNVELSTFHIIFYFSGYGYQ